MTIREINNTIEEGESLKVIALSYAEIASVKIRKIRAAVERNRLFFGEIAQVYQIIKTHAAAKKVFIKRHKPTLSILLTSNYGFYGNIDNEVIHLFLDTTPKFHTDRLVIGKTGQGYLKAMRYFNLYQSLTFKNDLPNPEELLRLASITHDYTQVLVFYPQLLTLLVQKAVVADITQSSIKQPTKNLPRSSYVIFEPELEKILQFFDSQITGLLLEQAFFEAELARTGSRLISMDQAQLEAERYIKKQKQLKAQTKRAIENTRLLESLTSIAEINKSHSLQKYG